MKYSTNLKAVQCLLESAIKDTEDWERKGCCVYASDRTDRKGSTKTGILDSIKIIRRMLMQVSTDIENKR